MANRAMLKIKKQKNQLYVVFDLLNPIAASIYLYGKLNITQYFRKNLVGKIYCKTSFSFVKCSKINTSINSYSLRINHTYLNNKSIMIP